jgi:hypothetical protein
VQQQPIGIGLSVWRDGAAVAVSLYAKYVLANQTGARIVVGAQAEAEAEVSELAGQGLLIQDVYEFEKEGILRSLRVPKRLSISDKSRSLA